MQSPANNHGSGLDASRQAAPVIPLKKNDQAALLVSRKVIPCNGGSNGDLHWNVVKGSLNTCFPRMRGNSTSR